MDTQALRGCVKGTLRYASQVTPIGCNMDTHFPELANYAGIKMDPKIFKIILELLQMNIEPVALAKMLKMMCSQRAATTTTSTKSGHSQQTGRRN